MRSLPLPAQVYVWAVALAGAAVVLHAAPLVPRDQPALVDLLGFVVMCVVADLRPVKLGYNISFSVSTALYFAVVIAFGAAPATCVAVVSSAASDVFRRKPLYKTAFNAAAVGTAVAVGGAVYGLLARGRSGEVRIEDLPAFTGYALANTVINEALLFGAIGLVTRTRPWELAAANYRGMFVPLVALFPLGVLMAVSYIYLGEGFALLLLAVPMAAVYRALNGAQQLRAQTQASLEILADAVDMRDRYTAEHSRRVAAFADLMARQLGLSLSEREVIISAARVHDLGKVAVPDATLRKPGSLTDDEWKQMRSHPEIGEEILRRLPMYEKGALLVGYHHERIDGSGYPRGARGTDIPVGARILGVADAFDAMTSDRPYRAGISAAQALVRLREAAGTQFCPDCVASLERALAAAEPELVTADPRLDTAAAPQPAA